MNVDIRQSPLEDRLCRWASLHINNKIKANYDHDNDQFRVKQSD